MSLPAVLEHVRSAFGAAIKAAECLDYEYEYENENENENAVFEARELLGVIQTELGAALKQFREPA